MVVLMALSGCGPQRLSQQDFSNQLAAPDKRLQPDFKIYFSGDSTFLLMNVKTTDFLYKKVEEYEAQFELHHQLRAAYDADAILDSATYPFAIIQDSARTQFRIMIPVANAPNGKGIISATLRDLNLNQETMRWLAVNTTASNLQQAFLLEDTLNTPLVRNYVRPGEWFRLHSDLFGDTSLLVRCYFRNYPHPAPPFSKVPDPVFSFRPDSLFSCHTEQVLQLHRPGIYHFQTDTSRKSGFTLFVYDPWFPEVKSPQQMLEPLRYLTMRNEYAELVKDPDAKAAADRFWLKVGGKSDRSKGLIRIYYQRVQEANRQFSSYVPGWKTDRGMIYCVFGPPVSVYRSAVTEQWTYAGATGGSFSFDFKQTGNPFTDNDYSLIRREEFDFYWYQAVEKWRQGNIRVR